MKTFSMTHVGQRRETNQDYMYTSETSVGRLPDLFLVADGMGGACGWRLCFALHS